MGTLFLTLTIISAVLLIVIVAIQDNKGGTGSAMGGSGASQMVGARRQADIVENATKILAGLFIVFAVLTTSVKASEVEEDEPEKTEQTQGKDSQGKGQENQEPAE